MLINVDLYLICFFVAKNMSFVFKNTNELWKERGTIKFYQTSFAFEWKYVLGKIFYSLEKIMDEIGYRIEIYARLHYLRPWKIINFISDESSADTEGTFNWYQKT